MKKIKVCSVFGTRPEAIKMAPLVKELQSREELDAKVLVTAQHREMLDSVLELFDITPDFDLNIMKHGQTIADITTRVLHGVGEIFEQERPDLVLVHGDTTTTFAAALASFYQKIAVGHVEAGLRTGNIYSPYPEEMNRKLTGSLSTYHFSPTVMNVENLLRENISKENIVITGNTVIDALLSVTDKPYRFDIDELNEIDETKQKLLLLTCHRRENWGEPMKQIFEVINELTEKNPDVVVVFPMHKNPSIRELARTYFGTNSSVRLIEPLDYEPFANLMKKSHLILTDSGGIQEEAPALGKPVLVLRTETERPEAVKAGTVKIAGIEKEKIVQLADELLNSQKAYDEMAQAANPYGDGTASKQIADFIVSKREELIGK
ncbi:non-hydrolyzing UDP-N-acetylglucosamine 2-epimerase [Filifactor alocis]|uniref:non-hydrolyzing UDP-N-acetylglucosamine 2-epimerase n=1 Tax=Filifactor alocis TaxID=143361 RepID=UPI0028F14783|nr:UDP-N-acetylglucosamine 2-epimerase (non-hydrolyzing) [Filifactor alocis]